MAKRSIPPTMAEPALRYCAFCGSGSPGVEDLVDVHAHDSGTFSVNCGECGGEGPSADTRLRAIELWNERFVLESETLPTNPLIQDTPSETLSFVAAMVEWQYWHPFKIEDGIPTDRVRDNITLGDIMLRRLVFDALKYEERRTDAAA